MKTKNENEKKTGDAQSQGHLLTCHNAVVVALGMLMFLKFEMFGLLVLAWLAFTIINWKKQGIVDFYVEFIQDLSGNIFETEKPKEGCVCGKGECDCECSDNNEGENQVKKYRMIINVDGEDLDVAVDAVFHSDSEYVDIMRVTDVDRDIEITEEIESGPVHVEESIVQNIKDKEAVVSSK